MKEIITITIFASVLSGCSVTRSDEMNNIQGIEYITASNGAEYVASYTVSSPVNGGTNSLSACVASVVSNDAVVLSGMARGRVSPVSGNYSQHENKDVVGGGETLKYADSDVAVANGLSEYYISSLMTPLKRFVKYTLTAKMSDGAVTYKFTNITYAQENSGFVANTGFSPLGAWAEAQPVEAINALKAKADQISSCLR